MKIIIKFKVSDKNPIMEVKVYKCKKSDQYVLYIPIKIHHVVHYFVNISEAISKGSCKYTDSIKKTMVNTHQRMHTGEKPYQYCNYEKYFISDMSVYSISDPIAQHKTHTSDLSILVCDIDECLNSGIFFKYY